LMVIDADELVPRYVEAGCDLILVHQEACVHLHRTLQNIRDLGVSPGVVLNPAT
ncbi:MAG: ribulose-phosphate 3-epimerase, partial [Microthrixaceae bacterium]|nr:ribulose-phosphate 3-epimerase [Microthrixaceae bacterium]